jgi:hypothetical protein
MSAVQPSFLIPHNFFKTIPHYIEQVCIVLKRFITFVECHYFNSPVERTDFNSRRKTSYEVTRLIDETVYRPSNCYEKPLLKSNEYRFVDFVKLVINNTNPAVIVLHKNQLEDLKNISQLKHLVSELSLSILSSDCCRRNDDDDTSSCIGYFMDIPTSVFINNIRFVVLNTLVSNSDCYSKLVYSDAIRPEISARNICSVYVVDNAPTQQKYYEYTANPDINVTLLSLTYK